MFKLSVISDEISQNLEETVEIAGRFGLDAVEIRTVDDVGLFEMSPSFAAGLKKRLDAAGLSVSALCPPLFKCGLEDDREIREHMEGLRHCVRLAEIFGAKLIRGFSFWKEGDFEAALPAITDHLLNAALLLPEGMKLVIESDPAVFASTAALLKRVVGAADCPEIRVLWDPGNDIYSAEREEPYPYGYRFVRGMIGHVHIKDAVRKEDGEVCGCRFGCGDVDYAGQLTALLEDGYDGYLTLETHYRKHSALDEAQLKRPGGRKFSEGGYEAAEESLEAMLRMLTELTSKRTGKAERIQGLRSDF